MHGCYSRWAYDLWGGDTNINFKDNTNVTDNNCYEGKVYGTGLREKKALSEAVTLS